MHEGFEGCDLKCGTLKHYGEDNNWYYPNTYVSYEVDNKTHEPSSIIHLVIDRLQLANFEGIYYKKSFYHTCSNVKVIHCLQKNN